MFINLSAINEYLQNSVSTSDYNIEGCNFSDGYYRPITIESINPRLTKSLNSNRKGERND